MIKVKVSTPWHHINYNNRISKGSEAEYSFDFEDSDNKTAYDFWIIWGGIKTTQIQAICPPQNVIFITDEVHEERFFYKRFLSQFSTVFTCRNDIDHSSVILTHELNTWMINRSFEELVSTVNVPKQKLLSVVCSDQTWLPGHKLRYAFVNKLIGHFKDRLDVFGKGFNPIADKYDALAPYKYSIAIENSVIPSYFTEKIADCFLTHTVPLYYGCPDIEKYFNSASHVLLDPRDLNRSIATIEWLLEADPYDNYLDALKQAKQDYLSRYHIFNAIPSLFAKHFKSNLIKETVTIKAENTFERGYTINRQINRILHRLPGKFHNFRLSFRQDDLYANPNLKANG